MEQKIQTIKQWLGIGSINIFGLPFAGKDTQGKIFADLLDGILISGGDILRQNKDNQELQQIMAEGKIIPTSLWEQVVVPYFQKDELNGKPLILSEVGRLMGEQFVVEKATEESGHNQKAVILLELEDKEIWNRFDSSRIEKDRGERADDNKEVLQTRLDSYHQKVMPVLDYYDSKGLLIRVDGALSREEVTNSIVDKLFNKISS
jgi:adenylate kinase